MHNHTTRPGSEGCSFLFISAVGAREGRRSRATGPSQSLLLSISCMTVETGGGGGRNRRKAEAEWGTHKRPGEVAGDSLASRALITRVEEALDKREWDALR